MSVDSDHYKVLNHLLALTGEGSDKFMLVAATNHKSVIDGAMARRFQDCVNMPLPEAGARKELIELYVNKVLFNVKDNGQSFVNNAKSLLNNAQIDVLVQDTEGFSSADIKDIVQAMRKKASATDSDVLTIKHINSAVSECIEKKRAFEEVVDY